MRVLAILGLALLAGCVSAAPLELADDHPASAKASSGLIGTSMTLEGYKTSSDFAARAAAEPEAPSGHAGHGGMAGMQHGGMPGMQHGETPGMRHGAAAPPPSR